MNQRQSQQQEFDLSERNLIVGCAKQCPISPELLAATTADSDYVVDTFQSGLTAEVFRVRFDGKDYTLKKKRPEAKVKNLDGQYSFLNEVQRRFDIQQKKDDTSTSQDFECIVSTVYADYRLGIILSDWIEGSPIQQVTSSMLSQLFSTLSACEKIGLFEWDLCGGNLLVDEQHKLWLFDFGYMYPFNPLKELNSNGLEAPMFNFCERFETRFLSGWLLENDFSYNDSIEVFKNVKYEALNTLVEQINWLRNNDADLGVLTEKENLAKRYQQELENDHELDSLFQVEMFRSHVLDIEDDLDGQSCTPTTIKRVRTVLSMLNEAYSDLVERGAIFYQNEGKSKLELIEAYRKKLSLVQQYQINSV
ncbi:phosphotransferase [Vibrio europaeus]|uniref:phosphotransferase n=1 Tax=Vibrio europaeus TaxID=300876 RepID=UPI00233F13E2|nr:phosphotransferase [Vibrio europaeus]MDC5805407.1 phosphotransferase [Vibrio europaeus]MDC5826518.1 phosphotransferase [Vibrio europaeus]MDC5831884.1 phosphotransferase [Vibrio europaeus]MDC5834839.1 phosphotransferase [Vibrio europaeus]